MDWMEKNPDRDLCECAVDFKKSRTWIYTLVNSDIFQARWKERRSAITNRIHAQLENLAGTSLGKLEHKLRTTPNLGIGPIRETAQMALDALGYSSKKGNNQAPGVQVNIGLIDRKVLAEAREAYKTISNDASLTPSEPHELEEPDLALPSPS